MKRLLLALSFSLLAVFGVLPLPFWVSFEGEVAVSAAVVPVAQAAVRVKGYFRKDGTYVQSHYRSNPDGNPYNNWSFPGNTNPYTGKVAPGNPDTYLKNYYGGSGASYAVPSSPSYSYNSSNVPSQPAAPIVVPGGRSMNGVVTCDSGYRKNYVTDQCERVAIPPHATLSFLGNDFVCDRGYRRNYVSSRCDEVKVPANATLSFLGNDFTCNRGFKVNYLTQQCDRVNVPPNATLSFLGNDFVCDYGFRRNYLTSRCDQVVVPTNARLDYFGSDFVCNQGYARNYIKNSCEPLR
jgi:hypothetical protein